MVTEISSELKTLVGDTLKLLGEAIKMQYGEKTFHLVERLRLLAKESRNAPLSEAVDSHQKSLKLLRQLPELVRFQVTHSFAVSLELINACENAYRSSRISQKKSASNESFKERITFVLTAHPTESRSPECIRIFSDLTELFVRYFVGEGEIFREKVLHLLLLALKTPVARTEKPQVKDEAEYIYSITLRKEILDSLIQNLSSQRTVFLRTWVGGDKDGHPGVDAKVMRQSLELSRSLLADYVVGVLRSTVEDLELLKQNEAILLRKNLQTEIAKITKLKKIKNGDGKQIVSFHRRFSDLESSYKKLLLTDSPHLLQIRHLLFLFPALVMPIELRENSSLIHESYTTKKGAIREMLKNISKISLGAKAIWYSRGLIISSTESTRDIQVALKLQQECLPKDLLPLVPLFESKHSLEHSQEILEELFKDPKVLKTCHKHWASRFEIMLGYSDSAKETGSLLSRILIKETLFKLEKFLTKKELIPVFFHGSGGSVARGGGSLEEQVSWWPLSSRQIFKVTLQGEMVYRSFSRPEIFNSQLLKTLTNAKKAPLTDLKTEAQSSIKGFATRVSDEYQKLIFNPEFLNVIRGSTPYDYLSELKIGSRPTKRSKLEGFSSLRAIPWILCWTQIRSLLPVWWGIGSTWTHTSDAEKKKLKKAYQEDAFFSSFVKLLAFSLAKVDLAIWFSYLKNLKLDSCTAQKHQDLFESEYLKALRFVRELTTENEILWFRPWLASSIKLRSTMIHPLNMAQIVALEKNDAKLLRETVTGIASGMLTTG